MPPDTTWIQSDFSMHAEVLGIWWAGLD